MTLVECSHTDITLLETDPIKVLNAKESGFNPLEYITNIDYYIGDLSRDQLKEFASCFDITLDESGIEDMREELEDTLDGEGSEELSYARENALKYV